MSSKNTAVFGIYPSAQHAERAVDTLIATGYPGAAISVLLPDSQGAREFAHQKDTKPPEGTTVRVTTGGVIGGTLGILAGVGGAVGGLVGALVGMGIPEYEAKRYEGRVKNGGTLLSVHCDTPEQISRAKDLPKGTYATDIASTAEVVSDKAADARVA